MFGRGVVCAKRAAAIVAGLAILPSLLSAQVFKYQRLRPENGHLIASVPFEECAANNYCGPAALTMVLNFWDGKRSFNQREVASQVFDAHSQATYGSELVLYPRTKGFVSYSSRGCLRQLREIVAEGIPVIVLMKTSRQVEKGHFRVVIGFDDDSRVLIFHDPYFGDRVAMGLEDFESLWDLGKRRQTRWMLAVVPAGFPFPCPELQYDPVTAINLATALYRRADYERSREQWEKARASLGDDPYLLYGLAMVSLCEGRPGEAEIYARQSLGSDEKNAYAHDALGLAYARQGKISEAFDSLGRAYRLAPNEASIRSHYFQCRDLYIAGARHADNRKGEHGPGARR